MWLSHHRLSLNRATKELGGEGGRGGEGKERRGSEEGRKKGRKDGTDRYRQNRWKDWLREEGRKQGRIPFLPAPTLFSHRTTPMSVSSVLSSVPTRNVKWYYRSTNWSHTSRPASATLRLGSASRRYQNYYHCLILCQPMDVNLPWSLQKWEYVCENSNRRTCKMCSRLGVEWE